MLELRHLSKSYGDTVALDAINLTLRKGELLAVLGPSGCGKSTSLKLIAGLEQPDSGDIILEGQSVRRQPPETRGVGMVFQDFLLFPHMTVADNIGFGLKMRGVPKRDRQQKVSAFLERIQLPHLAQRYPRQLSGGQQQRVALARTLIIDPKVLLLDEPLSSLDANLRAEMGVFIRNLQQELVMSTIFVTHDQQEALRFADRIAVMMFGNIVQLGSAEDIILRPRSMEVARFMGASNFFSVRVVNQKTVMWQDYPLDYASDYPTDTVLTLTVRPEHIALSQRVEERAEEGVEARVIDHQHLGSSIRYQLECQGTMLYAQSYDLRTVLRHVVRISFQHLWAIPKE